MKSAEFHDEFQLDYEQPALNDKPVHEWYPVNDGIHSFCRERLTAHRAASEQAEREAPDGKGRNRGYGEKSCRLTGTHRWPPLCRATRGWTAGRIDSVTQCLHEVRGLNSPIHAPR